KAADDGSEWLVQPDWEDQAGLVYDINQVTVQTPECILLLKSRFKNEPLYLDVIDALENLTSNASVCTKAQSCHCTLQYMIEDGKLWFVAGGTKLRACTRLECVLQSEAVELARPEHEQNGHWYRDGIKIALMDKIHSPKLDQSIIEVIL
ncbi:hypothetical protein HYPSUDRAFT_151970, partial [Hypholoma sublateritium FD-334 SS-4]